MNEEKQRICTFSPIHNFSDFQSSDEKSPFLNDCTLILNDGGQQYEIQSHVVLLANESEFFFNAFTSGMDEDIKREVNITFNPQQAFPLVMNYFYTGEINIDIDKIMAILAIARFYGIRGLYENLSKEFIPKLIENDNSLIIELIKQCYADDLSSELQYLFPFIAGCLGNLKIADLSENLDVESFCTILSLYPGNLSEKREILSTFIGDYQCTESEKAAINRLFRS